MFFSEVAAAAFSSKVKRQSVSTNDLLPVQVLPVTMNTKLCFHYNSVSHPDQTGQVDVGKS